MEGMDLGVCCLGLGHSCEVHLRGLASQESIGLYSGKGICDYIVRTVNMTDVGSDLSD